MFGMLNIRKCDYTALVLLRDTLDHIIRESDDPELRINARHLRDEVLSEMETRNSNVTL